MLSQVFCKKQATTLAWFNRHIPLRVQYAGSLYVDKLEKDSGLHLVKPVAPILVLTGNIGRADSYQTQHFISHCSHYWNQVVYVPGAYELDSPDLVHKTKEMCERHKNVRFLNHNTLVSIPYKTIFMGAPLLNTPNADLDWFKREFTKWTDSHYKLVNVSSGIPSKALLNSDNHVDKDLYPDVNAWICGGVLGSKTCVFNNGLVAAYNDRGSIDSANDFDESKGWSREAYIVVPENREPNDATYELIS
jgi:hypothetical protein